MDLVMEKIRSKASQYKSFAECAKALRMSQLEKRFPMDVADRNQLQKCLDTLQQSMKVNSLQGMVERLESISRQLSLKLMPGPTGLELFISSDMFYLEVSLELSGNVKDVKVHHEGKTEQQSCDELVKSLSKGDFDDFTKQLQGLISIYQLNAEKKVKCKAFSALCALESDLDMLWSLQSNIKDVQMLLNKSPVGILEKRKGGHPMKLTYFVSPYDILEAKKELTVELINKSKIGCSVTICLEGSAAHKLQTLPLITINKTSGKTTPVYATMTPANSTTLPAYFVLRLNKPMPICLELVKHINTITELECCDTSNPQPLFSLITKHVSNGKMDSFLNKGLFVNLPDQVHCYFMTECKGLDGVIVSSIPFTHPSQVPQILSLFRQQAIFNALVSSVIRPHSKQDLENMIMLEMTALSCLHISVSFEHPLQESMSTIEIDLSDISSVKATLYSTTTETNSKTSSEHISKILQRCLSIPVTMRYLIKTLQNQQTEINFNSVNNGSFSSAPNGSLGGGNEDSPMDASKIKQEPGISNGINGRNGTLGSQFDDFSNFSSTVLDNNVQKNSNLLNLVTDQQKKKRKHDKHWKSLKQKSMDDSEILLESSSNDSVSVGTPMEADLDPEVVPQEKEDNVDAVEIDDVEEMLKATAGSARSDVKIKKPKEMKKSPSRSSLIMDLTDGKGLVPPSVTITPITSNTPNINSVLERRPGIEIIPLSGSGPTNLTSSITITPISSSDKDERKNFKNPNFDDKMREKKKKRKREEDGGSKMGPPEKVPLKSDPLSKPVSVSIKPTTDSPPAVGRPNSPSVRKYTASPTQFRDKSSSVQPSPKHSPAYGSSPKHSPKHGTSSPKQPSSSSGKPSMSTLKSASSSPNSSKNSDVKTKSSSGSSSANAGNSGTSKEQRDKDSSRKSSANLNSSSGSPKIKSSSVKLKQLDISSEIIVTNTGSGTPPSSNSLGDSKNSGNSLQRNRKGSLSAVIDKLKSAQEVGDTVSITAKRDASNGGKDGKSSAGTSSATSKVSLEGKTSIVQKLPDGVKNPAEYMVKPSLDGMKITINKTRSKESSKVFKSGSSSGTGSPKTHTGLKPGVISGPASKKPATSKSSSLQGVSSKGSGSGGKISSSLKSSSSTSKSLSSKSTGSPKTSGLTPTDLSRKENLGKSRMFKSNTDKNIFKEGMRKSSPAPSRDEEHDRTFKVLKMDSGLPLVVEGLMKPFDSKFQIPKLSARNNNNNNSSNNNNNTSNNSSNSSNNASQIESAIAATSDNGDSSLNSNNNGTGTNSGNNNSNDNDNGSSNKNASNIGGGSNDDISIAPTTNASLFPSLSVTTAATSSAATSSSLATVTITTASRNDNDDDNSVRNRDDGTGNVGSNVIDCGGQNNDIVGSNDANNGNKKNSESNNNSNNSKIKSGNGNSVSGNDNSNNTDNGSNNSNSDITPNSNGNNNNIGSVRDGNNPSSGGNSGNNNNNNNVKVEKPEIKVVELTSSKPNLELAANLKYQTSKPESDRMAKVPSSNIPNLLSLPMGLTNISPKLPMTSPNLPTTSLSSITSKLDRAEESNASDSGKTDVETKMDVQFQSASCIKSEKNLIVTSSQQSSDILLDFSSNISAKNDKTDKSIFTKPNSPQVFGKSPAQSPLNIPSQSPQSITDDELMDEALMLRK